ncbi:MAG: hypothetical protein MI919_20600 [Holophagales bacterium]|nr:hypothetical protein [Holophagales bacterium]
MSQLPDLHSRSRAVSITAPLHRRRPASRSPISPAVPALAVFLAFGAMGCPPGDTQDGEAPEAEAVRVENAELGMAIASLPSCFRVVSDDGARIVLEPAAAEVEGRLPISAAAPTDSAINLVRAVEEHKADLESRPDGAFKGQRELGSQLGVAFYSRGQHTEGGATLEETAIFLIHPWGDRQLSLVYVYPAGDDTATRLQDQMFEVLGELEGLPRPGEEAAADDVGAESGEGGGAG